MIRQKLFEKLEKDYDRYMQIALFTLGCKLNQAESCILSRDLKRAGFVLVSWSNKASLYIINACSVTAKAEHETRQIVSQIKRKFPKSLVLVTGCFVAVSYTHLTLPTNREV